MARLELVPVDMGDEVLALLRPHFGSIKIPSTYDKVYKDECMFSFDTPFSPDGLYVSLSDWQGYGHDWVSLGQERTNAALFLRQIWRRVKVSKADIDSMDTSNGEGEPTLLAIGVEGGFVMDGQKYEVIKEHAVVMLKPAGAGGIVVPYPNEDLPTVVIQAVDAIIAHQGAAEQAEVNQWVADDDISVSKYAADLPQLPEASGKRVSNDPSTWQCEESGMRENLWLNLSTGYIGSGRRNWDGSGGTGAALRHYEETGRSYPLAVKLGTITPNGGDVFSYAPEENGMVKDPKLAEHLARWGIDIMSLEKTDKTMAELEVELNKSYDFNKITESGTKLKPLWGLGYTGLKNLGNSCYMSSCLQVLSSIPEVAKRYGEQASAAGVFRTAPVDTAGDFSTQMSKVVSGLLSGKYSNKPLAKEESGAGGEDEGVEEGEDAPSPRMFKQLVGRGHPEFSSGRQQDAAEFMLHLLEFMRRSERTEGGRLGGSAGGSEPTPALFEFQLVDRVQCSVSGTVKYKHGTKDNLLNLQIPVEEASNKVEVQAYKERLAKRQKLKEDDGAQETAATTGASLVFGGVGEEDEEVKPMVPLSACLSHLMASETIPDYLSPATSVRGPATKQSKIGNFPRYLFVKLQRYYTDENWQPKKLDVEVEVPETLDLEGCRSTGMQADEVPMPESEESHGGDASGTGNPRAGETLLPDESIVSQLMEMGFMENGCRRAAVAVQNTSTELAMNWVLEHMGDADFNEPLPPPPSSGGGGGQGGSGGVGSDASPEAVQMLVGLGFTEEQVKAALKSTGGDPERGADWLFSHSDNLDAAVAEVNSQGAETATSAAAGVTSGDKDKTLNDGPGRYSIAGFISHVGKNIGCGHYVAHIKKEGRWVIYNDRKVAESEHPPLNLGYLYVFRRDDVDAARIA